MMGQSYVEVDVPLSATTMVRFARPEEREVQLGRIRLLIGETPIEVDFVGLQINSNSDAFDRGYVTVMLPMALQEIVLPQRQG